MLLTLKQSSQVTGYSIDTLRNKIRDGSIPTVMIKNKHMIEEEDLAPYIKKVAKSRVHEQSHVEREVPQDNPFLIERYKAETERKRIEAVQKFLDVGEKLLNPTETYQKAMLKS